MANYLCELELAGAISRWNAKPSVVFTDRGGKMRKAYLLAVLAVCCHAGMGAALETPRVIELTDGSIPLNACSWSPDGTKIMATASDGVYLIKAAKGATPRKIIDIPIKHIRWLSNTELVGNVFDKQRGRKPRRMTRNYRFNLNGDFKVVYEGPVKPAPFISKHGIVWYDSADVLVSSKSAPPVKAAGVVPDFRLVNHYPTRWVNGKPIHDDTDLWLVSTDRTIRNRITTGAKFIMAKISGDGNRIVSVTIDQTIVVMTLEGRMITQILAASDKNDENTMHWVSDPELSRKNDLLLFIRGYDNEERQVVGRADLYLYDIVSRTESRVTYDSVSLHSNPLFNADGTLATCQAGKKILLLRF